MFLADHFMYSIIQNVFSFYALWVLHHFGVVGEEKLFLTLVNLASLSHDFCPPLILRYVAAGCAGCGL
jgi:hypothetical protein